MCRGKGETWKARGGLERGETRREEELDRRETRKEGGRLKRRGTLKEQGEFWKWGTQSRQPKQYGLAISLPCLGVSV